MLCKWQGHVARWLCGGVLYGLLEVIWRGHTHWTMMALAAALCVPLDLANEHFPWTLPLWAQAVLGGLAVTAGELLAGLVGWGWVSGTIPDSGATCGARFARCTPCCGACWPGQ